MAGVHEQVFFGQVRRAHAQIACLFLHFLCQPFQLLDDNAAARQPERQTWTDFIVVDEDFQLLAQFAVVALFGFFEHRQVLLKFLGSLPGRAVDARQHFVLLIAAPVGPSNGHQLDGRGVDLACVLDVRPTTQVRKGVTLVNGNLRLFGQWITIFVEAAFFQALDQFQLVRLVFENLTRLLSRNGFLDERMASSDDLPHALLNLA